MIKKELKEILIGTKEDFFEYYKDLKQISAIVVGEKISGKYQLANTLTIESQLNRMIENKMLYSNIFYLEYLFSDNSLNNEINLHVISDLIKLINME